ncbi:class I SAM-dependent methyltransferase [bacterium]|nr:class I SAM-dependent methyltransferase [bacterium]
MTKPRVIETDQGIQGEPEVRIYDEMQRHHRDKGWIDTGAVIKSGIDSGLILELGPGPGYLGLEWLKNTERTSLTGLDISPDMVAMARKNAAEYGLHKRAEYVESSGAKMPFEDSRFDAVISTGSLHEWAEPVKTLEEIYRVLKPGGRLFIGDLRRDMNPMVKWFIWWLSKPREIRPGFLTSAAAAYTCEEAEQIMKQTSFDFRVKSDFIGLQITGSKPVS